MLAQRVGANIRKAREARGWSLEKLGKKVDPPTSYTQISRLESGDRRLTLEWLEKLAKALSIDPVQLVDDSRVLPELSLSESVANEIARTLAQVALQGEEPDAGTVQVLALMLQELTVTFSKHPQAYRDPEVARPVVDLVSRKSVPVAS